MPWHNRKGFNERISHTRHVAGFAQSQYGADETSDLVISELLPRLMSMVAAHFHPNTDEQTIFDGVVDAIIGQWARFRLTESWREGAQDKNLVRLARRNVPNALRSARRRRAREQDYARRIKKIFVPFNDSAEDKRLENGPALVYSLTELVAALPDPIDQQILRLRGQGVRELGQFAAVLGIAHLTEHEQRELVNREKNRVMRSLRRWVQKRKGDCW